ncbi:30S ribosomal protein S16 [bacterium]|nr:30S ribosomal protein S16 [bacterium]
MMIKIRLARLGRKKRPFYRVVATNSRSPRDGKFLEILGTYDPLQEPSVVSINMEKLNDWVKKGAQLSNRVQKLTDPEKYAELVKDKPKRKPKKAPVEQEKAPEAEASTAEEKAPEGEASTAEEKAPEAEASTAEEKAPETEPEPAEKA